MGLGIDDRLVYKREASVCKLIPNPSIRNSILFAEGYRCQWWEDKAETWKVIGWKGWVAFCGKVYPFAVVCRDWPLLASPELESRQRVFYCWSYDDVLAVASRWVPVNDSKWNARAIEKTFSNSVAKSEDRIRKFFDSPPVIDVGYFHEVNGPIVLEKPIWHGEYPGVPDTRDYFCRRNNYTAVVNPELEDIGFVRVIDPFTTYQEISMFLGGVLTTRETSTTTVGSDKVIIAQKGFDPVESFRIKAPGSKKIQRKLNRERKKGGK